MTATRKPTVDLDRTRDLLNKLGLGTAAGADRGLAGSSREGG